MCRPVCISAVIVVMVMLRHVRDVWNGEYKEVFLSFFQNWVYKTWYSLCNLANLKLYYKWTLKHALGFKRHLLTKLHVVKVWKICRPTWRQFVYMPILTVWKGRKGFLILKRYNGFSRRLLLVLYSPSPLGMMSYMSAGGAGVATPGRAHCPVPLKLLANAECQLPHLGPADR